MSFIRPGQARKKKAFVRRRPQWDDSLNDLDSYKATPEEIRQRQEAHKSKHHISVKLEKMRKEKQKQRSGLSHVEARQVAIMKEVLHDQQQLDTVLNKTDHMLSMVKDLFGDDAKKYTGHPRITAPGGNQQSGANAHLPGAPEIRTRIEKLSESVMSQSALNDLSSSSEESGDEEAADQHSEAANFQPGLDLQSFQQFLKEEENRNTNAIPTASNLSQADLQRLQQLQQILLAQEGIRHGNGVAEGNHTTLSTISGNAGLSTQISQQAEGPAHSTQLIREAAAFLQGQQTPPNSVRTDSGDHRTPPRSALNDTGKVKKSKRRVHPQTPPQNNSSVNMTNMRQVLENLHGEIADFERKTGRRSATDVQNSETFTGYTVALVTAVTKLSHYMKETELRLQAEMMVREQLSQDVRQLTLTVDSLTQELILTQEESVKIASEFHLYRQQVQGEMALLQAQMLELKHQQPAQGSNHSTPGRAASAGSENGEEKYSALPDHMKQPSAAAVLLSPIVRKTRVQEDVPPESSQPKRQTSLVDIPSLAEGGSSQAHQQEQPPPPQAQQFARAAPPSNVSMAASASLSSTLRSDPPFLTQNLPVVATVSVPRPIPLVQSNVRVPLSGSQAAGPTVQGQPHQPAAHPATSSGAAESSSHLPAQATTAAKSAASTRAASTAMATQIAELNRQHVEAQQRLQNLLVQQKQQHDQLHSLQDDDAEQGPRAPPKSSGPALAANPHSNQQQGKVPTSGASPPISPISHQSEQFTHLDPIQRLASMSREIKVAMPMVDLEVSAGSLNSSL